MTCPHPRALRVFHMSGKRECGGCGSTLPPEAPTPEPEPST